MKIKNVKLEWYVLMYNVKEHSIKPYNALNNELILELHKEIVKKKRITNYEELKEYVRKWFLYHYWCKAEYEVLIGRFFFESDKDLIKIDVYTQLMLNIDRIIEYLIKKLDIKFK